MSLPVIYRYRDPEARCYVYRESIAAGLRCQVLPECNFDGTSVVSIVVIICSVEDNMAWFLNPFDFSQVMNN